MQEYSVLMSVYAMERPDYLRRSIDSMLKQTIPPEEIVIVKDGPLTETLEKVLEEYSERYPGAIKIVASRENLGLGLSLNLGLRQCSNELIARMDTDDISLPQRCEKQLRAFAEDEDLSIVGGAIAEFSGDEKNMIGKRVVPTDDWAIKRYLRARSPFNHVTVMFKKSEVLKAGGYQAWYYNEDYYLWVRMLEAGCKFANLPDVLVNVCVESDTYKRRGGIEYFKSEAKLQGYMLKRRIIGVGRYLLNVGIRFIVQVLLPSGARALVYRELARQR